jgi:hypothetical protein
VSEAPESERPRFEPISIGGAARAGMRWVYLLATVGCVAVAAYMYVGQGRPLTSGYVAAPAIGAVWFALRLFMQWGRGR